MVLFWSCQEAEAEAEAKVVAEEDLEEGAEAGDPC